MSDCFDLDVMMPAPPKRKAHGRFAAGHIPANKGKKWADYLAPEKQAHIRAVMPHYGILGKHAPNAGRPEIAVLATDKEGRQLWFESCADAGRKLGIQAANIQACVKGKRPTAGGWRFRRSNQQQNQSISQSINQ